MPPPLANVNNNSKDDDKSWRHKLIGNKVEKASSLLVAFAIAGTIASTAVVLAYASSAANPPRIGRDPSDGPASMAGRNEPDAANVPSSTSSSASRDLAAPTCEPGWPYSVS